MIYCVVPRELTEELYGRLSDYYAEDQNVTVIVDRRHSDRRSRGASGPSDEGSQRRVVRDRRRARVAGELPELVGAGL